MIIILAGVPNLKRTTTKNIMKCQSRLSKNQKKNWINFNHLLPNNLKTLSPQPLRKQIRKKRKSRTNLLKLNNYIKISLNQKVMSTYRKLMLITKKKKIKIENLSWMTPLEIDGVDIQELWEWMLQPSNLKQQSFCRELTHQEQKLPRIFYSQESKKLYFTTQIKLLIMIFLDNSF